MNDTSRSVKELIGDLWADIQRSTRRRQLEAIKAAPEKHRLTRIMAEGSGTNWTYVPAGKERKGKRVELRHSFCVAKRKNAAGVFLMWRQVDTFKLKRGKWTWHQAERFDFQWSPTKAEALVLIERKATKWKADVDHRNVKKLRDAPAEARAMLDAAIG